MQKSLLKPLDFFLSLRNQPLKHGILPNPSCDLDSLSCVLALSYFLYCKKNEFAHPLIPPDIQLNHRFEFFHLYSQFNGNQNLYHEFPEKIEKISLVDHNQFDYQFKYNLIDMIIDHHEDTNKDDSLFRKIEKVGSCATLILSLYEENNIDLDPFLRNLLCGAVLVDTGNFDPSMKGRWMDKDFDTIEKIMKIQERDILYNQLRDLKFDQQLNLALDQKIYNYNFGKVVYTSLPVSFTLLEKQGFKQTMLESNGVMCVAITAYLEENILKKEIIIFSKNTNLMNQVKQVLIGVELQKEEQDWIHLKIIDLKQSRKTIEPLISKIQF